VAVVVVDDGMGAMPMTVEKSPDVDEGNGEMPMTVENSPDDDEAYGPPTVEEGNNEGGKPLDTLEGAAWAGKVDVAAAGGKGVVAAAGGKAAAELGAAAITLRPMQPEIGGML
jgi:hypothetical protein